MRNRIDNFLSKARESSCLISESKILSQLELMGKAVVISTQNLENFNNNWADIKKMVEGLHQSKIFNLNIDKDENITSQPIGDRNISDSAFFNIVQDKFSSFEGYCFVVNSGIRYLLYDGKIDENVEGCLQKTKSMQEKLDVLYPVANLEEVFEHFQVECTYKEIYYNNYFDKKSAKVKANIKEQELRNLLMNYLNCHMRGDVDIEFCTDYVNDEESVDIYVNDGKERAIIEVKFSLPHCFYLGPTHYNLEKRIQDGMEQLNKYAMHLAKDSRLVDYGYVYVFYMSKNSEESVKKSVEQVVGLIKRNLSNEFLSIFKHIILNNMQSWGSKGK